VSNRDIDQSVLLLNGEYPQLEYSIPKDDVWSLATGQLRTNWGQPTARVCLCCSKVPTRVCTLNNQLIHYDGNHGHAHGPILLVNNHQPPTPTPIQLQLQSIAVHPPSIHPRWYQLSCVDSPSVNQSINQSINPDLRLQHPSINQSITSP